MGIPSMAKEVNFIRDGFEFKIPVYLIQGEKNIATVPEVTKAYFDKIEAADKAYYLIPDAGHGQIEEVVSRVYQILQEKIEF